MIYVDKTLEEWLAKYPHLKPRKSKCTNCKAIVEVNVPFIERGYVGLAAQKCPCGKNENRPDVRITTSEETASKWRRLVSLLLGD